MVYTHIQVRATTIFHGEPALSSSSPYVKEANGESTDDTDRLAVSTVRQVLDEGGISRLTSKTEGARASNKVPMGFPNLYTTLIQVFPYPE